MRVFKRLNAPVGQFGMAAIHLSTRAINADDATYANIEAKLDRLVGKRDALVATIQSELDKIPGCTGFTTETADTFNQLTASARELMFWVQQARGTDNPDDDGFTDT